MATQDNGSQDLTFQFKEKGTSKDFNRLNLGIAPGGIYKGGRVTLNVSDPLNPVWDIAPFTAIFPTKNQDNRDIVVNITTESTAQVAAFNGGIYNPATVGEFKKLRMRYIWQAAINSFIDFDIASLGNTLSNEIILCRLTGRGAAIAPDVSYDLTTFGPSYEGLDDRSTNTLLQSATRVKGDWFRLTLEDYTTGSLLTTMFLRLWPCSGTIELQDESDASFTIKFTFSLDPFTQSASTSLLQYPAGYKVSTDSSYPDGFLSIFLDTDGKPMIVNRLGSQKTFLTRISLSTFQRV